MENNTNVPYIVFEGECARHERTVKRLVIVIIITIALLVASNMAWLYVFNQYDISSEVVTVENEGDAETQNVQGIGANAHGVIGNESAESTDQE